MSKITESIRFLKEQDWIDLTHTVTPEMPYFQAFRPISEKTLYTVQADGFFAKEYALATQYGTHIDAPIHFSEGKRSLEVLEIEDFVLPLLVIHKEKEVESNHDYILTVDDILAFEREYGDIPSGSFVAFSSGWSKRWSHPESYYNLDENGQAHTPGWSVEALKFLHKKRAVKAVGHETLDTDPAVEEAKNGHLLGELYWLSTDNYQVEVMNNLFKVPAKGAAIIIGAPKIKAAPGFNVRAFAIAPKENE